MVAAFNPLLEPEPLQQGTKLVKTKSRVGCATEQAAKSYRVVVVDREKWLSSMRRSS